jgi:hypothetical protein
LVSQLQPFPVCDENKSDAYQSFAATECRVR